MAFLDLLNLKNKKIIKLEVEPDLRFTHQKHRQILVNYYQECKYTIFKNNILHIIYIKIF